MDAHECEEPSIAKETHVTKIYFKGLEFLSKNTLCVFRLSFVLQISFFKMELGASEQIRFNR